MATPRGPVHSTHPQAEHDRDRDLTPRDHFAAAAMAAGIRTRLELSEGSTPGALTAAQATGIAASAYVMAEAMLREKARVETVITDAIDAKIAAGPENRRTPPDSYRRDQHDNAVLSPQVYLDATGAVVFDHYLGNVLYQYDPPPDPEPGA